MGMRQSTLDKFVGVQEAVTDSASRRVLLTVLVSALGYFVDIYDLVLFSIYRVASLKDMGIATDQLLPVGVNLMNLQMTGMVVGGIAWGILGDKRGRTSVLFGSILVYSLANIGNAFVHDVTTYGILRFLAGFGLAGEIGAGVTLVSEVLGKGKRSYGSAFFFSVGLFGAVVAAVSAKYMSWRTGYFAGGLMGLALLAMRASLFESGMYKQMEAKTCRRGSFRLFLEKGRWKRYLAAIFMGVPTWFGGLVSAFLPEFAHELGITGPVSAADGVFYGYLGVFFGSFAASMMSQWLKSRKKTILIFLAINTAAHIVFFTSRGLSPAEAGFFFFFAGFFNGYCALFVVTAAELFGTNLRSTVATSVPNFVRAGTIPMAFALSFLSPKMGLVSGALVIESVIVGLALLSLWSIEETHGKDLDYIEE